MTACDNEKLFKNLMTNKFGNNCLGGKKSFGLKLEGYLKATISVDESVSINGKTILIEIDSGNMAKLLAGQYALLNGMYTGNKSNTLFLVVHYYRDSKTGKLYNPKRTLKNLNTIQHFNPDDNWIPFSAFNSEEFKSIVDSSVSLDEFIAKIWPNNAN